MKSIILPVAVALFGMACTSQPEQVTINGQVEGYADSSWVYLRYAGTTGENTLVDSVAISEGTFTFTSPLTSPRLLELVFKDTVKGWGTDRVIQVFAEPGELAVASVFDSIRTERQLYMNQTPSEATKVTGSAIHQQFVAFQAEKAKHDAKRSAAFNDYIAYLNPGKGNEKEPYDVGIALVRKVDEASAARKEFVLNYVDSLAPSPIAAYAATLALDYNDMHVDDIMKMRDRFAGTDSTDALAHRFLDRALTAENTAVGSKLVDFELTDVDGNTHRLGDYIGQGKYVLLEFWASWCGPCRADFPHLRKVYDLYHDKGFEVIGVSLDDNKDNWMKALGEEKLSWLQLHEPNAFKSDLTSTYRIRGIPACLLFDPAGNLVTRNMRGSWMDAILIDLYGNQFASN